MTPLQSRCLDSFPAWLRSLAADAESLASLLESAGPEPARRWAAVALTYLFKSLDLIPDGLEDLGYVDDTFVLRVAAARVTGEDRTLDSSGALARLAADVELIREFLGSDFARLETYVARLESSSARGRSVEQVLGDSALTAEFVREVRQWAESHVVPSFTRDEKNLVKLRSFLAKRLEASV